MATSGLTCVVRQGLSKLVQPSNSGILLKRSQKLVSKSHTLCPCVTYCSSVIQNKDASDCIYIHLLKDRTHNGIIHCVRPDVSVEYRHGLSIFTVPLPSRRDSCEFVLKPVSHTVKDFIHFLQEEDKGIDRVTVFNQNGNRIAGSTTIDILLKTPFRVVINENSYDISPPEPEIHTPSEDFERFSEVKTLTAKLYSQLNVEEHQLRREAQILKQLEEYNLQIAPLLKQKSEMEEQIMKRITTLTYVGAASMGLQFGFFARLTWWEYSWDVMEPVTYFATYTAIIFTFAYFCVTSGDYEYAEAWNRSFTKSFYTMAQKNGFDIDEYNRLANMIAQCESDLRRLRDPLQVHLPIREME